MNLLRLPLLLQQVGTLNKVIRLNHTRYDYYGYLGGARLASSNTSALVTITENDDIHGVFEFATGSLVLNVEEPASVPRTVELELERREGAEGAVRITWSAVLAGGGSAASDVDVTGGELLYQSQERSKTFSIQVSTQRS